MGKFDRRSSQKSNRRAAQRKKKAREKSRIEEGKAAKATPAKKKS